MLVINYYDDGLMTLVGDDKSVLNLAHILEARCIKFKVAGAGCSAVTQDFLGLSGFEYWMNADYIFGSD